MDQRFRAGILASFLCYSATAMAVPGQYNDVASLINIRLSYMKDVAGFKAEKHLAVEDLSQESTVLSGSVAQAERLGLDGNSVRDFIQTQMDAAKAIQYRYRADWLSRPETNWQPMALEQVRQIISASNTQILTAVSVRLKESEPFTNKAAFMKALNQKHLEDSDKERLWTSLVKITLKKK